MKTFNAPELNIVKLAVKDVVSVSPDEIKPILGDNDI